MARIRGFYRREKEEEVLEREHILFKKDGISQPSIEDFSINDINISVIEEESVKSLQDKYYHYNFF